MAGGEPQVELRKRDRMKATARRYVRVPLAVRTSDLPKRAASAAVMLAVAGGALWAGGIALTLFIVIVAAACTTQVIQSPGATAVLPQLSVERSLQAANSRDLHGMGRLFRTSSGPVMETGGTFGYMFKKIGS